MGAPRDPPRKNMVWKGPGVWATNSFHQKRHQRSAFSGGSQVPLLHKQKKLFCEKDQDIGELIYMGRQSHGRWG